MRAVVAAGNKEIAVGAEREAGGIDERGDERLDGVAGVDFVERDRNALAAGAAEGDVDISGGIDGRTAYRMQVVGDLESEGNGDTAGFRSAR